MLRIDDMLDDPCMHLLGQSDDAEGREIALHVANTELIPGIP